MEPLRLVVYATFTRPTNAEWSAVCARVGLPRYRHWLPPRLELAPLRRGFLFVRAAKMRRTRLSAIIAAGPWECRYVISTRREFLESHPDNTAPLRNEERS